jgi:selenide,water dikinase
VTPRLVLAGLGHAHLFVLEALAQRRLGEVQVLVCTAETHHVYSGMVPGWLAGRYTRDDVSLDTERLCRQAGAQHVPQHVIGVDATARQVRLASGETLSFDLCSIAVGSVPSGLDGPGVREHALPLKPLAQVEVLRARLAEIAAAGGGPVVIVGAGLAGLEIAFAMRTRLLVHGVPASHAPITVCGADSVLVAERGERVAARIRRACARRAITVRLGARVTAVEADRLVLQDGEGVPSACTVWATGAAAPTWLAASGLPVDARGFLRVDAQQRVVGQAHVFAAGDCATPEGWPATPKAGVHAVRMGPVLVRALAAALAGRADGPPHQPQRRFLALLDTGDGRAIGSRAGLVVEGRWVRWWKDRLDQSFVQRFRAPG